MTSRPRVDLAIARATDTLAACHLTDIPVPIEDIAQRYGFDISTLALPADTTAVIVRAHGRQIIGVNDDHTNQRRRFSVAHSIGHVVMHLPARPPQCGDAVVDHLTETLIRTDSLDPQPRCIEANAFASQLLMPRNIVMERFRRSVRKFTMREHLIGEIADAFEVSRTAMGIRLASMHLIDPT